MAEKEVTLDLAEFLDSPEARALEPARADVRTIAEAILGVCYGELGKKPHLLDGQDVDAMLRKLLPGRLAPKDPLAEHVPVVLAAYIGHLESTRVVTHAFETRRALDEATEPFLETVRTGRNAELRTRVDADPFVHGAPKLGRNDPCSCGSGKKYKKCHGRNA